MKNNTYLHKFIKNYINGETNVQEDHLCEVIAEKTLIWDDFTFLGGSNHYYQGALEST